MNFNATQIRVQCPICGKGDVVTVDTERYQAWKDGMLIQDAFPGMPSTTRELILTGTCSECWSEMGEEEV